MSGCYVAVVVPQGLAYGEMLARGTNPEVIDGEILSRLSTKCVTLIINDIDDLFDIGRWL